MAIEITYTGNVVDGTAFWGAITDGERTLSNHQLTVFTPNGTPESTFPGISAVHKNAVPAPDEATSIWFGTPERHATMGTQVAIHDDKGSRSNKPNSPTVHQAP